MKKDLRKRKLRRKRLLLMLWPRNALMIWKLLRSQRF